MKTYAKISPKFWLGKTGRLIRQTGVEAITMALYLLTNPHARMFGIYYLPISFMSHETGLSMEQTQQTLASLIELGFCDYDADSEYVWVYEMARFQIADYLRANDKQVVAINRQYQALGDNKFIQPFFEKYAKAFHLQESHSHDNVEHEITHKSSQVVEATADDNPSGKQQETSDTDSIQQVFQHWQQSMAHSQAKLDGKRRKLIKEALALGYSVATLSQAISGCAKTPYNMGDNDRGQRFDGLHVILRDADQIDRFIRNYHQPPKPGGKKDVNHMGK